MLVNVLKIQLYWSLLTIMSKLDPKVKYVILFTSQVLILRTYVFIVIHS